MRRSDVAGACRSKAPRPNRAARLRSRLAAGCEKNEPPELAGRDWVTSENRRFRVFPHRPSRRLGLNDVEARSKSSLDELERIANATRPPPTLSARAWAVADSPMM